MQLLSPMLFLRTLEILENSKHAYYEGSVPEVSESERKKIMDFLTQAFGEVGKPASQTTQHSAQPPGDHPPLWARGVFMHLLTGTVMEKYKGSAIERQLAELTFALIRNADKLHEETAPKLPLLNQALQKKERQQ